MIQQKRRYTVFHLIFHSLIIMRIIRLNLLRKNHLSRKEVEISLLMTDIDIIIRTPTILMCKLGVQVQPVVDRTYHNRSKLDTHIDEYVTM